MYISAVPDIRDRFSGAVEAFARRNGSGLGLHGDHSRHRSSDDVPSSSKDVVSILVIVFCVYDMNVSLKLLWNSYT